MGSAQLDCSDITAKEGSSSKQLSALVGDLVKCRSEDEKQVEASQAMYCGTKARLLSSGSSILKGIPKEPFSSDSSKASLSKEKEIIPRVGENYQVEIPTLLSDSGQYPSTVEDKYLVGLTVPVVWVQLEKNYHKDQRIVCTNLDEAKETMKSKNKKSQLGRNKSTIETNFADVQPDHKKDSPLAKLGIKLGVKAQLHKMNKTIGHFLVPEIQYESWNDADVDNFLLGLHIFGKNFAQTKRFIENKSIGDILSFYYGKFCGSNMHRRWSDCIKRRNKKRAWGKKLFSGWRQKELISRLLPHVTEENQSKLLEVSKSFIEEEISLETYAFSLKGMVGLQNLAKAVGAGRKGKEDLTGIALAPACPKIPEGKACSSLEPGDIIRSLTGGFRLSKSQQNDIFWEAVWPRLLARGWHSEQPENGKRVGSRSYLAFLKPGVDSFSRKKLVRGEQYFDSVRDVLKKVASKPQLLDLKPEMNRNNGLKEFGDSPPENSDKEDIPNQSLSSLESEITKLELTIVDTSAMKEEKPYQLRQLRDARVNSETSTQCPVVDTSRQRPRERPLTTKALEALAMGGFYNVRKRKRSSGTKKRRNTSLEEKKPDMP